MSAGLGLGCVHSIVAVPALRLTDVAFTGESGDFLVNGKRVDIEGYLMIMEKNLF